MASPVKNIKFPSEGGNLPNTIGYDGYASINNVGTVLGTSATVGGSITNGCTCARTAVGTYTWTFNEQYYRVITAIPHWQTATAEALFAQCGGITNSAGKTVITVFTVNGSGTKTDPSDGALMLTGTFMISGHYSTNG